MIRFRQPGIRPLTLKTQRVIVSHETARTLTEKVRPKTTIQMRRTNGYRVMGMAQKVQMMTMVMGAIRSAKIANSIAAVK